MTRHAKLRILVVDDDPDLASLLKTVLKHKLSAETTTAGDCASARQALAVSTFDAITMDYELPDGNGIDLMEEIVSVEGHPPVVMVTGKGDEKTAARAFLVGAAGYITKDQKLNTMLVSVVRNALERTHSEKLQSDSEIRYRRLFESARDGILILDADTGKIEDANPYLIEILGYSLEEFVGKHLWEIGPFKDAGLSAAAFDVLKEKRYIRYENLPLETKDGSEVDVEFVSNIYISDHREVIQCNIRDITVRAQEELLHREHESELAEARILLEETGRMAEVGGWELDVESGKQVWTREVYRIHEVDQDFQPTVDKGIAFYAAEAVPVISEAVKRAIDDGEPFDVELRLITAKGNERWIHTIGRAERVDGRTVKVRGTFQDVTDRKQAEERRKLVAELLLILNRSAMSTDAIREILDKVKDFTGLEAVGIRLQRGNDFPYYETSGFPGSFLEVENYLCSYSKERGLLYDELGRPVLECMCGNILRGRTDPCHYFFTEGGSFWHNSTTQLLATTTVEERQTVTRNYCNTVGYESVAIVPLRCDDEIIGLIHLVDHRKDMFTLDLIEFFEEVGSSVGIAITGKEYQERIERANRELDGYAHTVSHDLKGPISAVSLAFDLLMSVLEEVEMPAETAEQLMETFEIGRRNASNANILIDNLLVLAEAGEPQEVSYVSIEETIGRVLEESAEIIKEKRITVEVASPLGGVVASPTHIYQLFSNLICNSFQHNNAENPVIEISNLGADGTVHRFLVRDNGKGIPEAVQDDLFTPFVKAQSKGSGIGLSIVEKIVKAYSGEITAYNDRGACFEFRLMDYSK
ncbi:MAG: PAS domain S-box protein [Actinomycetota bacterium]